MEQQPAMRNAESAADAKKKRQFEETPFINV